jgi:general secretion pathway protein I
MKLGTVRAVISPMHRHSLSFAPRRHRGFSLIEMVAAFLVFAIGLGILMQILTSSLHHTQQSSDYTQAALRAQSVLDTTGVGERLEEGHTDGRFDDGFRWEMDIEKVDPQAVEPPPAAASESSILEQEELRLKEQQNAYDNPDATAASISPVDIYQVALTMYWGTRGRERHARFATLRAANPDPNEGVDLPGAEAPDIRSGTQGRAGGGK